MIPTFLGFIPLNLAQAIERNLGQPRVVIKPTLRRNPHGDEWLCSDRAVWAFGWGTTPEAAYELWLKRFSRRMTEASR